VPYVPFDLYTDASNNAIGAALLQNNKVVNFYSKHLDPIQQRYSATMRETYGMVQSILHYRTYLIGSKFTVYTDHKPLVQWFTLTPLSDTYAKWMVKLQGLTFEVKYVEGEKNVLADLMSRPHDVVRSTLEEFHKRLMNNSNKVQEAASKHNVTINALQLLSIFDWVKAEQTSEVLCAYKIPDTQVKDIDGAYFFDDGEQPRLIVPPNCTQEIIRDIHSFGHFGPKRCVAIMKLFYYWPPLRKDCILISENFFINSPRVFAFLVAKMYEAEKTS
jgi:RNase H-like domain found in reverse transcriptase/Integrase zinc binding domain